MVNPENLILGPVGRESTLQRSRAAKVLAERLLHLGESDGSQHNSQSYNDSGNTLGRIADLLQMLADRNEDGWRQGHVEDSVCLCLALFELLQMVLQVDEGFVLVIQARDVRTHATELLQLSLHVIGWRLHVRLDAREVFGAVHLGPGIADDLDPGGEEFITILLRLDETSSGIDDLRDRRARGTITTSDWQAVVR
jgi:hypothetical protein